MARIVLDAAVCDRLASVGDSAEICDEQGNVVGRFVPREKIPGMPPPGFEIPLSMEEIQRRRGTRTGRTLDEILKDMGLR